MDYTVIKLENGEMLVNQRNFLELRRKQYIKYKNREWVAVVLDELVIPYKI